MRKLHFTAMALLAAAAVHAHSRTASALSCATNSVTSPQEGETNVPTNTLLWGYGSTRTARLVGPDGDVALEEYSFPASGPEGMIMPYSVLRPLTELVPETRYTLFSEYDSEDEYPPDRTVFVTSSGRAETPPPLPQLLSARPGAGPTFFTGLGRWVELEFALRGGVLLGTVDEAVADVPPADPTLDEGPSSDERIPVVVWIGGSRLTAGTGDCMAWPGGSNRYSARFGVMDMAGNFSGWSSETLLELPDQAEADRLVAEAEAAERAREDEIARLQQSKPRMGAFEGHNMGCALGDATSRPPGGPMLLALGVLAAARGRFRKRLEHIS